MPAVIVVVAYTLLMLCGCGDGARPGDLGPDPSPSDAGTIDGPTDVGLLDGESSDAGDVNPDASADADSGTSDTGGLGTGQVRIAAGIVEGAAEGTVYAFRGIPYAAAPTLAQRFRPPASVSSWSGVRAATAFGPTCPQRNRQGQFTGDEDCLHLNVWAHLNDEALKPVMVWIHGGGFIQGSSSVSIYDGAPLAQRGDVVVVTINYRIGALGFLALPDLIDENDRNTAGNYGVLDQIFALQWVRDNIDAFGGDPSNVTVFGESAGGSSVCALLAAPDAAGLFHRAVIQSGGGCYGFEALTADSGDSAVDIGELFVTATDCNAASDRLRCLRQQDATALTAALFDIPTSGLGLPNIGPAIDGIVIAEQGFSAIERGAGNRVPLLLGSNRDETVSFNAAITVADRAAFERLVALIIGPAVLDAVVALYPEAEYPVAKDAYNALSSDLGFNCSAEAFARAASATGLPVFLYHFDQQLLGPLGSQGVLHGQEIAFVFGTLSAIAAYVENPDDVILSASMLQAWTTFARTGTPSVPSPAWTRYTPSTLSIMNLATPRALSDRYRNGRCDALRGLGLIP